MQKNDETYKNRALSILEELPPEKNAITNNWVSLGIKLENAGVTQALLQLTNEYCTQKKCLNCLKSPDLLIMWHYNDRPSLDLTERRH